MSINDILHSHQAPAGRDSGLLCHSERSEESRSLLAPAKAQVPPFVSFGDDKISKAAHYAGRSSSRLDFLDVWFSKGSISRASVFFSDEFRDEGSAAHRTHCHRYPVRIFS